MSERQSSAYGPTCPIEVKRATMIHRWDRLTFLHWAYPPEVVQALLPTELTVETYDGRAWVALVPFEMVVRPPRTGTVPWLSRFCETNVRTYVVGPDGTTGVWFLSLDAARLPAVATARTAYNLPYFWSKMSIDDTQRSGFRRLEYRCRRRWPGPKGASSHVTVEVGDAYRPEELLGFDHFLTARWRLYSVAGSIGVATGGKASTAIRSALAEHPP